MKTCLMCNKQHERKRSKYCSNECGKQALKTPENRLKISVSRKKYLKDNPDKHPWKRHDKFKSKPCELVKDYLKSRNITFIEEWQPLEDRIFAIDIAFPDIKFGIEINGNQHYNRDGSLKEYYQNRHNLIEAAGWKLLELHYSIAFKLSELETILQIKNQPDYTEFFRLKEEKKKNKAVLPRGQKQKEKYELKNQPMKEIVLNSNIDFSKYGWVLKVSKLLDIKQQKVNGWMKRFLPEFYEKECFKRKQINK